MNEKMFNTRIQHKHDVEANWLKAANFIPKAGELIVYDADENYDYTRVKIGNGVNNVNDLPFITDGIHQEIQNLTKIIAVDDGEGNIELKPFLTHEDFISNILAGEY